MIYQQQTVAADAPVMREMAADAHGSSSSYFCAAVAAMAVAGEADAVVEATAAASSGSYCLCASVAAMADVDSVADSANHLLDSFAHTKRCQVFVPDTSLLLCKKYSQFLVPPLFFVFRAPFFHLRHHFLPVLTLLALQINFIYCRLIYDKSGFFLLDHRTPPTSDLISLFLSYDVRGKRSLKHLQVICLYRMKQSGRSAMSFPQTTD